MSRWNTSQMGTNHSSGVERSICNKFRVFSIYLNIFVYIILLRISFVCVILIDVKSKYGSCSGSCTGIIKYDFSKNQSFHSSMVEQKSVNFLVKCSNHFESYYKHNLKITFISYIYNYFKSSSVLVKRYNLIFRLLCYRFESYIHL